MSLRRVAWAVITTEDMRWKAAETALPDDFGEACHEVLSLSSAVMENGTGSDSRQETSEEGAGDYCVAGPISLVAQSGAQSKAAAGLVFSTGPADPAGIASPWWLPRPDRCRAVTAVRHGGSQPGGGAALTEKC